MRSRCPPGVICIENITIILLFIVLGILFYSLSFSIQKGDKIIIKETETREQPLNGIFTRYNYGYTNLPNDILLNPYAPPLRDERYFIPELSYVPPGTIPINVSTNIGAVDTTYRQVGILNGLNTKGKILPLMGRPLFVNRDKWQYYTISDQHNNVKLPVSRKGKSCTNEYGCDKLYDGDTIYIDGANEVYKVTIYDNDTIKYLPFL